jgi:hypothetical protein
MEQARFQLTLFTPFDAEYCTIKTGYETDGIIDRIERQNLETALANTFSGSFCS